MPETLARVHATAVAVDGRAALIVGPSGAGKSDLALRLITVLFHDGGRPVAVRLVSDDQVVLERHGVCLVATAPPTIAGRLEVRGLGITTVTVAGPTEVHLIVDISPDQRVERLPDPPETRELLGVAVPVLRMRAFEASAASKVVVALLGADRG